MEKRKIEALRDLAIAHYPKASKQRADAMKYQGGMWADCGLTSALIFEDYAATAVEKQARELLQLTFMHPDARPLQPLNWDGAEDGEKRMLEQGREWQPQIEVALLDAARLLCELADVALPRWIDAVPKSESALESHAAKAEAVPVTSRPSDREMPGKMPRTAIGKLTIKAAWKIECETGKRATPKLTIEMLQAWVETEPELVESIPHGVKWETTKGKDKPFDIEACSKALEKWNTSRP